MAWAYLIVICDKDTNAVKGAEIWSSPEWEQSRQLPHPTFVAYQVNGRSYDEARHYLIRTIRHPGSRYHWLMKYLTEYRAVEMVEATEAKVEAMAEAKTETETKPENMIDPSCDWVEIVDPEHVLRADIDQLFQFGIDDWAPVSGSAGRKRGDLPGSQFRCLRRDHPDYQKAEALKLEIGKRYVMRNGVVVGPLKDDRGVFTDDHVKDEHGRRLSWKINGRNRMDHESQLDIVAEYSEPVPTPEPEPFPQKPSLGVMPRKIWLENRLEELRAAISRYEADNRSVAAGWRAEEVRISQELSEQPLRWVENCKPDKPGIWALMRVDGSAAVCEWSEADIKAVGRRPTIATRCYLGPIPEILPPLKKVVQRLWLLRGGSCGEGFHAYQEEWIADDARMGLVGDWIRTDRTREVEQ